MKTVFVIFEKSFRMVQGVAGELGGAPKESFPDVVFDWISPLNNWDVIKMRNIGTATAFTIQLDGFSWPELVFSVPVHVNMLHPDSAEVEIEPRFAEMTGHGTNIGRLNTQLRSEDYSERAPLEVTLAFSDARGGKFSRNFRLEPRLGGGSVPNIIVTPLALKRRDHQP